MMMRREEEEEEMECEEGSSSNKGKKEVEEEEEEEPLSPIVGYNITSDDDDFVSYSSDTDPETIDCLNKMNARLAQMTKGELEPVPNTPRSAIRRRIRKRKMREMLREEEMKNKELEGKRRKLSFQGKGEEESMSEEEEEKGQEEEEEQNENEEPVPTEHMSTSSSTFSSSPIPVPSSSFTGAAVFTTAGGKNISISSDALAKAQKLWMQVEEKGPELGKKNKEAVPTKQISTASTSTFRGPPIPVPSSSSAGGALFKTAGGKNISISSDALARAQKSWMKLEEKGPEPVKKMEEAVPRHQISTSTSTLRGAPIPVPAGAALFKTAAGRNISISSNAMVRAQKSWIKEEEKLGTAGFPPSAAPKVKHYLKPATSTCTSMGMTQEVMDSIEALLADEANEGFN